MGFEEKKRVKFSKCFSFAFGYLGEINTFFFSRLATDLQYTSSLFKKIHTKNKIKKNKTRGHF